jgi:YHS domain-containing protein
MQRASLAAIATAALLIGGCSTMIAQTPNAGLSPVNAIRDGGDDHVILRGYDVVSYFTEGKDQPGSPAIKSVYKSVTFRFSTPGNKALFDAAPEKYIPQFGAYCSDGIVYAIPAGGNPDTWKIIDGKLYIFGGQGALDGFMLDVPRNMALANKYWAEEVNGSNPFVQRYKRWIFRVPHYVSGKELAEQVAAAKAQGKL